MSVVVAFVVGAALGTVFGQKVVAFVKSKLPGNKPAA